MARHRQVHSAVLDVVVSILFLDIYQFPYVLMNRKHILPLTVLTLKALQQLCYPCENDISDALDMVHLPGTSERAAFITLYIFHNRFNQS